MANAETFKLLGAHGELIGLFSDRVVALTVARETLGNPPSAPTTVVLQGFDGDDRLVVEQIISLRCEVAPHRDAES